MTISIYYVFKLLITIIVAFIFFAMCNGNILSQTISYSVGTGNFARLKDEKIFFHPGMFNDVAGVRVDAYFSRPYGIKELEKGSFMVIYPVNSHRFGLSYGSTGNKIFSENELSLMHMFPLKSYLFLTNEFNWLSVSITGFDRMSDFSVTEGIYFTWNNINAGLRVVNIASSGTANSRTGTNRSIQYLLGYKPSVRVATNFAVISESGFPAAWVLSTNLMVYSNFALLIEVGEKPSVYSIGAELQRANYRFTYHLKQHQDLGSTSQIGVSYSFSR